ncbi:UvrD-helicase domain-containing protein [Myroides odoratimimus]|uniref:UvrD-helicase domain-containing protein n=1 Tax=Myroides odoratimimus TaxID=76832 RepID=UPI000917EDF2|nr:UvrD-helicase domain-containing protein [Myroides odoratimimus]SHL15251.1 ATP-dependent exoDNAse (exonuclease V) beta subunit (contains helicase and exonuclease domains) [Myroides odoratimimus subsp. xuanwuensis]
MLDKPSFSIYNASAGSGKTHTLVKEYLKILLLDKQDDAYKKILAITFTNKAVAEMKTRVVSCLNAFSKEELDPKYGSIFNQVQEETELEEGFIRAKSGRIIRSIIHNYASFDISTIDKFTHKVIRSFAFDLELPMTFEVSLDSDELLQEAVDAVIAKAGVDSELTDLLIDFSIDKADNDKSWDITRELKEVGALLLNENNREEIALFSEHTLQDFVKVRDFLREEIKKITAESIVLGQSIMDLIESKGMDKTSFSGQYFVKHIENVIQDTVGTTKRYHEFDDIKIKKTAKDVELIEAFIPDFLKVLAQVYDLYSRRAFYTAFLKNLTPLSLLSTIGQEMDKIQEEQNILSITQFNAIIHNEIQNQPAPFIYERLGERYHHFFIDEFQDTSEMQWQNLVPLIDNALAGEDHTGTKGSLMIVGDPKQSIYRWRGGKAEQFIALSKDENPFANPDKQTVNLGRNYRSYAEVIQFNNRFFKDVSRNFINEDYKDLYENNSYQEVNSKAGGYVNIEFLQKDEGEDAEEKNMQYAQATLNTIQGVLEQGFDLKDIVILTRKRDHGVLLANYLTENGLEILSSDSLLINNASEVRLIINVLKFLKTERDLEAKMMMLYYVSGKQSDLTKKHDFIKAGLSFETELELEAWLIDHNVPISFESCRSKSLYDAVEAIVLAFLPDKSASSYVLYFLDLVLEKSLKNQFGISDFLEYWNTNYHKFSIPTPEGRNAVQIMTIHKSKGLEFPIVIFPFAEEDFTRPSRDKLWVNIETDKDQIMFPKALVDSKKEVVEYGEYAQLLYEKKEQEMLLDNVNVLYVALTRAEEQLYIISYKNVTSKGEFRNNLSKLFLDFLVTEGVYNDVDLVYGFGDKVKVSKSKEVITDEVNKMILPVKSVLDFEAIKIAQREALMWDSLNQKAIEYGNLVHKLMSFITDYRDVDAVVREGLEKGLIQEDAKERFKEIIQRIVSNPDLEIFFREDNIVFNERVIIGPYQRNTIPDRVVVRGRQAYILDYKTGKEEEKYKDQVKAYGQSLVEMGYEVVKMVLLYTGENLNIIHL